MEPHLSHPSHLLHLLHPLHPSHPSHPLRRRHQPRDPGDRVDRSGSGPRQRILCRAAHGDHEPACHPGQRVRDRAPLDRANPARPGRNVIGGVRPCDRSRRQCSADAADSPAWYSERRAARTGSHRDRPGARRISEQRHARDHQRRPARRSHGDAADRRGHQSRQQRRATTESPGASGRHQHAEGWRRGGVAGLCGRRRSRARLAGAEASGHAIRAVRAAEPADGAGVRCAVIHRPGAGGRHQRYAQIVEAVSRQAVQLDNYWSRIKANCTMRVTPGHDREWFGLWDGRAKLDTPDASCGSAVRESSQEMASQTAALGAAGRWRHRRAGGDARRASVIAGSVCATSAAAIAWTGPVGLTTRLRLPTDDSTRITFVRIGIDARKLHDFGIGTYIRNLLRELAAIDRQTEYVLVTRPQDMNVAASLGENFRAVADDQGTTRSQSRSRFRWP